MSDVRCLNCKYLEITPEISATGDGICHLNPPSTALVNGPKGPQAMIISSMVKATSGWCSHHELQLVKPVSGKIVEMPERKQ